MTYPNVIGSQLNSKEPKKALIIMQIMIYPLYHMASSMIKYEIANCTIWNKSPNGLLEDTSSEFPRAWNYTSSLESNVLSWGTI
jgi:hypothetical protein